VVITGWRRAPLLLNCLRSIASHHTDVPFEVTIVLSSPDEQLVEELVARVRGAEVLSFPVNLGFGGACNRGAAAGTGEFVVFLNDDTEVRPGWLAQLVATARDRLDAGAVGSANFDADGTLQQAGAILWHNGWTTTVGRRQLDRLGCRPDRIRLRKVDYCGASSLLVRRSTWDAVGGFDEEFYPAYFEDLDLCLRIAERGQSVLCQPLSCVVHYPGSSSTEAFREFVVLRNHARFVQRWQKELDRREPFGPDDPESLRRALELAARPLTNSDEPAVTGPSPPGRRAGGPALEPADELHYLRRELDLMTAFARELEQRGGVLGDRSAQLEHEVAALGNRLAAAEARHHALARQLDEAADVLAAFRRRKTVRVADGLSATATRLLGRLRRQ
jgi:GT2 family glycosyltransferase